MRFSSVFSLLTTALSLCLVGKVQSKAVFAHYMVGNVYEADAHQDIDDAIAMGLDGFALNIGDATQPFVSQALGYLFGYAAYRGFKLYISMDVYASGAACYAGSTSCNGPSDYHTLLADFLGSTAWYRGPNGLPMISTFSSGGFQNTTWNEWKNSFAYTMYFIPDFDETLGYYEAADEWWNYWGGLCEGVFSWEAAWPKRAGFGGAYPGDISPDIPVVAAAHARGKGYMIALSTLQYKNSYGTNVYRAGDENMPVRMANILAMADQPDFVQIITWNDGPESHYFGNLWLEQNNDTQPANYANQDNWSHNGWRPLYTSFIAAYKAGGSASSMAPPSGQIAVGALWYKTILQSAECAGDATQGYYLKPDGYDTGTDSLNWAIVLKSGLSGYKVRAISNGVTLNTWAVSAGLNHGHVTGVQAGSQSLQLLNAAGTVVMGASGAGCVSDGCPEAIWNMNYQVVPLSTADPGTDVCEIGIFYQIADVQTDPTCKKAYDCVNCYTTVVNNANAQNWDRWAASDADTYLYDQTAWYLVGIISADPEALFGSKWDNMIECIIAWFGGANAPQNYDCASLGVNSCDVSPTCSSVSQPALFHVLSSVSNLHNFFTNQYIALGNAEAFISAEISSFQSVFAPTQPDSSAALKLALDIFGMVFGIFSAGIWNKILKNAKIFSKEAGDPDSHGWMKDTLNSIVSTGTTLAKDVAPGLEGEIALTNDISKILSNLVSAMQSSTDAYIKYILGGNSLASNAELQTHLTNGKWLSASGDLTDPSLFEFQNQLSSTILSFMIPAAWGLNTLIYPVVIYASGNVTDNPSAGISKGIYTNMVADDVATANRYYYSDHDVTLWLFDAHSCTFANTDSTDCAKSYLFQALPGADKMTGSAWGNLTVADISVSTYLGYNVNGKKQGYVMPESSNLIGASASDIGDYAFQNGFRTPGYTQFPMCTMQQAFDGWRGGRTGITRCSAHPCCVYSDEVSTDISG